MEINIKFGKGKKFVSGFVNIFLVLAVLVVLFPLSIPTAKADTLWYDNWDIWNGEDITLDDDTIILNGTLWIHEGGKLTLDNCILQMRYKSGFGHLIDVDGTFNLLNNSLITTNSTSPDPYEFRIDGAA